MNNPLILDMNTPELGTLEDLVVALRTESGDLDSGNFPVSRLFEDYFELADEMAILKNTSHPKNDLKI